MNTKKYIVALIFFFLPVFQGRLILQEAPVVTTEKLLVFAKNLHPCSIDISTQSEGPVKCFFNGSLVSNTSWELNHGYNHETVCRLDCPKDSIPSSLEDIIECVYGSWKRKHPSGPKPKCIPKKLCSLLYPLSISDKLDHWPSLCEFGSYILPVVGCKYNVTCSNRKIIILTCQEDGNWFGPQTPCLSPVQLLPDLHDFEKTIQSDRHRLYLILVVMLSVGCFIFILICLFSISQQRCPIRRCMMHKYYKIYYSNRPRHTHIRTTYQIPGPVHAVRYENIQSHIFSETESSLYEIPMA